MDTIQRKLSVISVKVWLWIIISMGVLARLVAVMIMGDSIEILPGIYDQVSYHTLATRLLNGHGFTFATEWWPVTQAGEPTAHWSYLYTFYLTGVYALVGVHPLLARLLQALIVGGMMPWLAFNLGISLHPGTNRGAKVKQQVKPLIFCDRDVVGLIAAAWVAFYGYFIYYSAALMTEMFYITAILGSLVITNKLAHSHYSKKGGWGWYALLGLAISCAVLLRQVYLIFVPFIMVWLLVVAIRSRRSETGEMNGRKGWVLRNTVFGLAVAAIVVVVMILPFTWWNYHQFGRFVLLNTNAGYAFFWANHPIHGDDFVPLFTQDMPTYQELIPPEVSLQDEAALDQELLKRGVQFVLDDLGRYIRLCISRIDDHFIFWPKADSSLLSNVVRVMSFGVALPFTLAGAVMWKIQVWKQKAGNLIPFLGMVYSEPGGLLLLYIVTYVGVHILSWAGIRYRLPADAVMLTFSAYALAYIIDKVIGHRENTMLD